MFALSIMGSNVLQSLNGSVNAAWVGAFSARKRSPPPRTPTASLAILGIAMRGSRIPFAEVLQPALCVDAIWWIFPVSALCSMLMSLAYYRWGNWCAANKGPRS